MVPAVFIILLLVVFVSLAHSFTRSHTLIDRWLQEHDLVSTDREYRAILRGPFFLNSTKSQTVYRLRVRTRDGQEHTVWLRCGGYFFGLFSDQVEARWDPPSPAPLGTRRT